MESSFHFPGSNSLCSMALWPQGCPPLSRCFLPRDTCPGLCSAYSCTPSLQVPDCCPGFFGTLCEPCPGGLGGVCSGHGQCQDRLLGSGECRCREGFHGTACEMCELGRYGPNCTGGEDWGGGRDGGHPGRGQRSWRHPSRGRTEAMGNSGPPSSTSSVSLCPWAVPGGAARGWQLCL